MIASFAGPTPASSAPAMAQIGPRKSVCVVDEAGRIVAEKKIATCADAIASRLTKAAALHKTG